MILVLDLHTSDPESLSELAKDYEAGPKEGISSSDILGQLLYTSKLGTRLLDAAVAFSKDAEETIYVTRRSAMIEAAIKTLLEEKPKMLDMEEDPESSECLQFLLKYIAPIEKLAGEVYAHDIVSDKVAMKNTRG